MRETGGEFDEPRGGTTPLQPRVDRMEPVNFPYRGQEQHGVPAVGRPWIPQDAEEQSWQGEETYDAEATEIVPVPVVIVQDSHREIRSWRAHHGIATTTPSLCVGQNPRRSRVRITNIRNAVAPDGDTVYVGHTSNVTPLDGYPIRPDETLEILTEEEIYCVTAATALLPVEIGIILEHAIS